MIREVERKATSGLLVVAILLVAVAVTPLAALNADRSREVWQGIMVGGLLGGAVVIEQVFSIPGMGRLIIGAVLSRDFPVIQGGLLFLALIYLVVNIVVDLLYAVIDPRVRLG